MPAYRSHVLLCAGGGCISSGLSSVRDVLDPAQQNQAITEGIRLVHPGSLG